MKTFANLQKVYPWFLPERTRRACLHQSAKFYLQMLYFTQSANVLPWESFLTTWTVKPSRIDHAYLPRPWTTWIANSSENPDIHCIISINHACVNRFLLFEKDWTNASRRLLYIIYYKLQASICSTFLYPKLVIETALVIETELLFSQPSFFHNIPLHNNIHIRFNSDSFAADNRKTLWYYRFTWLFTGCARLFTVHLQTPAPPHPSHCHLHHQQLLAVPPRLSSAFLARHVHPLVQ